jgi:hypothetical protein
MNFADIRDAIVKLGLPILGAALPLPGGAAIGSALAAAIGSPSDKPNDILATLHQDADAVQRAMEFQTQHEETLLRISVDAEKAASEEVTKRWQADMSGDSWLAKNIRPMVLIFILTIYTIFASMSAFSVNVTQGYVELLGQWGMLIMSAYFVGRTVEKLKKS